MYRIRRRLTLISMCSKSQGYKNDNDFFRCDWKYVIYEQVFFILSILCYPFQCADVLALKCKEQVIKRLQKKGIRLFKMEPKATEHRGIASCNTLLLPSYKTRCQTISTINEEYDRIPKFLKSVSCGPNCDPKCCAVTYWVTVLKKQRSKNARKREIWVLTQQEIVMDYVSP